MPPDDAETTGEGGNETVESGTLIGHGTDDVGDFKLAGEYKAAKLAITKMYVPGTGDPNENLGHTVELRLSCCELEQALPDKAAELQSWGCPPALALRRQRLRPYRWCVRPKGTC